MPSPRVPVIGSTEHSQTIILKGMAGDIVPASGYYALQVVSGIAVIEDNVGGSVSLLEPQHSKDMMVLAPGDYIDFNDSGVDNNGLPAAGDKRAGLTNGEQFCLLTETAGQFAPLIGGNGGAALTACIEVSALAGTPILQFTRQNGSNASPTKVVSGNLVGQITVSGYTGGGYDILKSVIELKAAGDWDSTSDEPLQIVFKTIPDGTSSPTTAMVIDSDQTIYAGTTSDGALDRLIANNQTGATYTTVLSDRNKMIEGNRATAQTFTIPLNATVAYPIGTVINFYQMGAGQITVAITATGTLRAPGGAKTRAQYSVISAWKRATDEWVVSGDTTT